MKEYIELFLNCYFWVFIFVFIMLLIRNWNKRPADVEAFKKASLQQIIALTLFYMSCQI